MKLYIGCSGFYYDDWKGSFYPVDIPKKEWLSFYSDQFKSVEINRSFYKIPAKKDLINWAQSTPDDFCFIFKGFRYITHLKKLNIDEDLLQSLEDFYDGLAAIEDKIAGILWQLPANFPHDLRRIEKFSTHLKKEIPNFFEFRKPDWFNEETLKFLNDLNMGFCTVSAPGLQYHQMFLSNQRIYLRLHGKYKWYDYEYDLDELKEYHLNIKKEHPEEAYIFFNNDVGAQAPANARQMQNLF